MRRSAIGNSFKSSFLSVVPLPEGATNAMMRRSWFLDDTVMMDILHWIGAGVGVLFIGLLMVGFWRSLSLRPSDPSTRPPERWM
jgi:hypothetical protein